MYVVLIYLCTASKYLVIDKLGFLIFRTNEERGQGNKTKSACPPTKLTLLSLAWVVNIRQ